MPSTVGTATITTCTNTVEGQSQSKRRHNEKLKGKVIYWVYFCSLYTRAAFNADYNDKIPNNLITIKQKYKKHTTCYVVLYVVSCVSSKADDVNLMWAHYCTCTSHATQLWTFWCGIYFLQYTNPLTFIMHLSLFIVWLCVFVSLPKSRQLAQLTTLLA